MRDLKQADAELWETIPEDTMAVIAARTALRLLPNTSFGKLSRNPALNITHDFRQVLIQVVSLVKESGATASKAQLELVRATLRGTIDVVDELKHKAPYYAAKSAAAVTVADAAHFAVSAQQAAKAADISEQVSSSIVDLALEDGRVEQQKGLTDCFAKPLLPSTATYLLNFWEETRASISGSSTAFSFWRDWYQGFLDGKPLDWDLQHRVALIDDTFWDAGPEAVAAEIERIRAEFSRQPSGEDRFPKHEPKSVSHLFDNRVIASASLQGLAEQVTHSIERFHAETGANALPEALEPLTALPALLLAVNSTIQKAPHEGIIPSETEDQLRAEIGRLNAKVAQLQEELRQASDSKPSVFSDAFKKQLGTSLGDWKLYAALCTGIWFVSGDIEGMQRRLEDISHYRDMIFGEVSSPSGAALTHSTAEIEAAIEI
ncbi:hypothetical protein [Phaeobacter porticola]|uniref:Uncharacterized protein n=1 Tax=Phaeobacter porticola TaxID=1844006 RepID=A0A1L3I6F1_9RHOB|nr:hypothetical protein [Phaeobacter porticola]APG47675.1 hypothetical protein PhaeoP97_02281 [Phaeobacter porticola]